MNFAASIVDLDVKEIRFTSPWVGKWVGVLGATARLHEETKEFFPSFDKQK